MASPDLRALTWNAGAEQPWGVRADEARGQYVLRLDIGLPVVELRPMLRRQAEGTGEPHQAS